MAVYKVPQDVEAEDKLIGPFSFRQFIYLIIAAIGILLAWGLSRIFVGLLIVPLPIITLFLILALPLRKDQPMETYLAAVIRFFLKPRQRLWSPEGTISLVNITAPKTVEYQLTKGITGSQASEQLSYLAQVMDTQGWSTRGVVGVSQGMHDIVVAEAQATTADILDEDADVSRAFEQRLAQADEARKQAMLQQFQQAVKTPPAPQPAATQLSTPVASDPTTAPISGDPVSYNPYPNSMHQRILNPASTSAPAPQSQVVTPAPTPPAQKPTEQPSAQAVSPDIIRLANNNDLSISTLAHEAHRLMNEGDEVEISLR